MIEPEVLQRLFATPAITDELGQRLYPAPVPPETPVPFGTYDRVSTVDEAAKQGPTGLSQVRLSFACWGPDLEQVRRVCFAIRNSLVSYRSERVIQARSLGVRDLDYDADAQLWGAGLDVLIECHE